MLLVVDNESINRLLNHLYASEKFKNGNNVLVAHDLKLAQILFDTHFDSLKTIVIDLDMPIDSDIVPQIYWEHIDYSSLYCGFALYVKLKRNAKSSTRFFLMTRQPITKKITRQLNEVSREFPEPPEIIRLNLNYRISAEKICAGYLEGEDG